MSKKEELKEQVETEALMDAEVEAATDCGCCCSTKSKKEAKEEKEQKSKLQLTADAAVLSNFVGKRPLTVDSAEVKL